ncbi:AAA family ATPase [Candidatus Spongiisocius sp.]|uniref:AAA family ATPase n=1 Tax=Candidatus Spongiisocius sp. TaxID=3101273 RepID=UPI003B5B835C
MEGKRFIRAIHPRNILSYGPDTPSFELEPLNVLIGPNASGKSNLIDVLSVLRAAPGNLASPIRRRGGTAAWLWKGREDRVPATVEVIVDNEITAIPLRYRLKFAEQRGLFLLWDEAIEDALPVPGHTEPAFHYRYGLGHPVLQHRAYSEAMGNFMAPRSLNRKDLDPEKSILSQHRDPITYPELTYLANQLERISLYRETNLGPSTSFREPQKADLPHMRLLEDGSNLGVVLSNLMNRPAVGQTILKRMRTFYPYVDNIVTTISGGTVQIFFHERELRHPIPATRLSDGSLHYLFLLAVLCNPDPDLVTCIEEPEIGLHPDIIPEIADLLVEASSRTQLIVTTHSDVLVDALTEVPESVVICEKQGPATSLRRLDRETLKPWLERYRLGELWSSGNIGGNRW